MPATEQEKEFAIGLAKKASLTGKVEKAPGGLSEEQQLNYFATLSQLNPETPFSAQVFRDDGSSRVIEYRGAKMQRQFQVGEGLQVTPTGELKRGTAEEQLLAQRLALPVSGEALGITSSFFAEGRDISTTPGKAFQLFEGGGIREVAITGEEQLKAPTIKSSLFEAPGPGVQQQQLAIPPAEGKTIARTGRTGFNPATGVDVPVGPDEIFIEYTDGTYEVRKTAEITKPTQVKKLTEAGPTAEELGIAKKKTETVEAIRKRGGTAEEMEAAIKAAGLKATSELEFIGPTYRSETGEVRQAPEGYVFYQDKETRQITARPEGLKQLAQPSTSPRIAAERGDVKTMFTAVFGREPNAAELRYWQGRTDKQGAALIGAMQFHKKQGQSIGGKATATSTAVDPITAINQMLNDEQKSALVRADAEVGTRLSASLEEKVKQVIQSATAVEDIEPPTPASMLQFIQQQQSANQMQEAQNNLNKAQTALRQLDADFASRVEEEELRPVSMAQIRRRQSAEEVAYNRARRDLQVEVQMYSDIVQSQLAITDMMINAFQYDQQQAQNDYVNRFNKAMAIYNISLGEREFTLQQQQIQLELEKEYRDNQRANLGVISSLISEGRINYDQLDPASRANIARMEQAVGLTGLTQAIANTPLPKIMSVGSTVTDASGIPRTQIISQDPLTGELSISYYEAPFTTKTAKAAIAGKIAASPTTGVSDSDYIGIARSSLSTTQLNSITKLGTKEAARQLTSIGKQVHEALQNQFQMSITPTQAQRMLQQSSTQQTTSQASATIRNPFERK